MTAEATFIRDGNLIRKVAAATIAAGELHQLADGRAGYLSGRNSLALGDPATFKTTDQVSLPKTAGVVLLDGGRAYWDYSANAVTYKKVSDRDFYAGRIVGDAASADTTCTVNLNVDPPYDLDLARDPFDTVLVGTVAAGGFGYPVRLGGALIFELTATSEAQKVDALGVDGFAVGANAIIDGSFRVLSDGGSGSQDISIGVASGTHASDFEAVAEFAAIHLDGNVTNINAESDDGTTDVNPTDTTADYTEGNTLACRVYFSIDLRDPTAVKFYVNGARVLSSTTFSLGAAVGPLFLIVHVEKAAGTDVYKLAVDSLRARFAEQ